MSGFIGKREGNLRLWVTFPCREHIRYAWIRKTHLVYFPLENIDGHAVLRIMEPITRSNQ